MTKNINKAIGLTSYLYALPPASSIVFLMLALGLFFGMLTNLDSPDPLPKAIIDGFMLLALPALLSSLVIKLMIRKMPFRRIAATALGGELVYSIAYGISLMLSGVDAFWAHLVIMVGSAIVFVFWYVIARFVFILKYRSFVFAIVQLLFYITFLLSNQALYVTSESFIEVAAKFYISSFLLLGALVIFFLIINAPMKKSFGVSSTDAISYFFSQWLYHNKDMEKAFEQVGGPVKTFVSVLGFKREKGTVFFVTPCVHFGPFGNLGGSEFSYLLADRMDEKYKSNTFVFHGTVTHDLNPVASAELNKILAAVDSSIKEAEYADAKVSISLGKSYECRAQALRFNDSALIGVSRAPKVTEDINFGLGLAMMYNAEKKVKQAMIVDQHNAETGDITSFEPGSAVGYKYLSAVADALSKKGKEIPLKLGIASRVVESGVVGGGGIKVAIFSSSPEYVVVLIDSNGVTPKFRDRIESEVREIGDKLGREFTVGVYTTDTHQTNITRGVLNPLKEEENILALVKEGCMEAASDMQKASFFAGRKWFDINVLGAKQSIEIISTVNSIVAVAKITLPLIFIGALLLLIAVATKLYVL